MKAKTMNLVYPHEYNAGYVGKTSNLKGRFNEHCSDNRSSVKQFCNERGVKHVRRVFEPYEIMQCDKDESSYYEGRIYDLIKIYFPYITLINKNKPNRSKQEYKRYWRSNNLENIKANYKKCIELHPGYLKQWHQKHPTYFKDYYKKKQHRNKSS